MKLEQQTNAKLLNSIVNHKDVRPWIANSEDGVLDLSYQINQNNVCLLGDHGGCMFLKFMPGIYEVHTQVLPSGRGQWTKKMTAAAFHWMFTKTDCWEITTRIPEGHIAAIAAARARDMRFEFTRPDHCRFHDKEVPVHLYALRIQDWVLSAPDLADRGAWFHTRLHQEAHRLGITEQPHAPDDNHNRYVGAAADMAFSNQIVKAANFYNRWAVMARHPTVSVLSSTTLKIDIGTLRFCDNDIEVISDEDRSLAA